MSNNRPTWDELSGYVDGELSPADAARLAATAAQDGDVARRVADLHAMKSALDAAYNQEQVIINVPPSPSHGRWRWYAAAGLALAAVIALALWPQPRPAPVQTGLVASLVAQHETWRSQTGQPPALPASGGAVKLPDLSAAGLAPLMVERLPGRHGSEITHIGYLGRHGCRLSLFIVPRNEGPAEALPPPDGIVQTAAWSVGTNDYFAIAKGLNSARFAIISEALKAATQKPAPLEDRLRIALANAQQPCAS